MHNIVPKNLLWLYSGQWFILQCCPWYLCVCSPPVPVGVDSQGRAIPGEVPKLFGGEIVKYILVSVPWADGRHMVNYLSLFYRLLAVRFLSLWRAVSKPLNNMVRPVLDMFLPWNRLWGHYEKSSLSHMHLMSCMLLLYKSWTSNPHNSIPTLVLGYWVTGAFAKKLQTVQPTTYN